MLEYPKKMFVFFMKNSVSYVLQIYQPTPIFEKLYQTLNYASIFQRLIQELHIYNERTLYRYDVYLM